MTGVEALAAVAVPSGPLRSQMCAEGWIPPERAEALEAIIRQIAAGGYLEVPTGEDALGLALRDLARSLGRQASKRLQSNVDLSIKNNSNLENAVWVFRDIRQIGDQGQAIAAAAEELVSSVETISDNSAAVATKAREALGEAHSGAKLADQAIECMERIAGSVSGAARQVDSLGVAAESIGQIVSTIEEIAFHTNMIALNAAVEAARAGEAGKGFMVVADEVKRLARQTKEATVDITNRISTLRADMESIVASMGAVDQVVSEGRTAIAQTGQRVTIIAGGIQDVTGRITEVAEIIDQQKEAAAEVAQGITIIAGETDHLRDRVAGLLDVLDEADGIIFKELDALATMALPNKVLHLAKADHVRWKKNIAAMLVGRLDLEEEKLTDHHTCRLGRWYDQVTEERLLNAPSFPALEDPHRAVHAAGKEATRLYNAGDHDGALTAMNRLSAASQQVLELLERVRQESRGPSAG